MELLLFRHGIAEDASPSGRDEDRRLTERGIDRTIEALAGLAQLIDPPDRILTSPKVRAVQTAELAGDRFALRPDVLDCLGDEQLEPMVAAVRGFDPDERVMLVGHEPTLGMLLTHLCTQGQCGGFVEIKKAGCAALEVVHGRAWLRFLATAKMLRSMV